MFLRFVVGFGWSNRTKIVSLLSSYSKMISLTNPRPTIQTSRGFSKRPHVVCALDHERILYWGSGSHPSWRVMIVLEEKGLPYESRLIEFSKRSLFYLFENKRDLLGEHKGPEIMALNPRGQVPTFKDGDALINESGGILMYLENQYPQVPLLPTSPAEKAKVCFPSLSLSTTTGHSTAF